MREMTKGARRASAAAAVVLMLPVFYFTVTPWVFSLFWVEYFIAPPKPRILELFEMPYTWLARNFPPYQAYCIWAGLIVL